ncbi:ROK family transcriptional regulator [Streptomyces sp. 7-21]|uniref:ROK family transcriptional regulator n=1 Tax=Streptomyces sp. 7-21 TaxID=2802283 RepID=UPI00191E7ECC|nr:ROK family transcriptional regulator [Streptomyces sp. 7-21]MBL1069179.1 ROK family transcriptional regulator [Streptomyces sp. 7-21]
MLPDPDGSLTTPPGSPGRVLALIAAGAARTRSDVARLTGLARSTVSLRVEALITHGLLEEIEDGGSTGGRPPRRLRLRTHDRVVAGIGLGATHCRVALVDLGGGELASREDPLPISEGPAAVLGHAAATVRELLTETGKDAADIRAIGVGVPGPVDFSAGELVDPPIMPDWHRYPIPRYFTERFGVPALVDNDVNVMALAEQRQVRPHARHLLFVKAGTGIGCGIVSDGRLHRGAHGSAGDIGHIRVGVDSTPCRCGNAGCLEAVAGGAALARRLRQDGLSVTTARDVAELAKSGQREAMRMLREAGRRIGEVLSGLVNFFNPEAIVLGGALSAAHEQLLAGVREAVYRRSYPLATQDLLIEPSRLRERAASLGAATLAIGHALSPDRIDRLLAPGSRGTGTP